MKIIKFNILQILITYFKTEYRHLITDLIIQLSLIIQIILIINITVLLKIRYIINYLKCVTYLLICDLTTCNISCLVTCYYDILYCL